MDILYMYGKEVICNTNNASLYPNKEDIVVILGKTFKVKNVIWHINNIGACIEIQLEKIKISF